MSPPRSTERTVSPVKRNSIASAMEVLPWLLPPQISAISRSNSSRCVIENERNPVISSQVSLGTRKLLIDLFQTLRDGASYELRDLDGVDRIPDSSEQGLRRFVLKPLGQQTTIALDATLHVRRVSG